MAAILIISFIVMATVGAFALAEQDDCSEISGGTNAPNGGACGKALNWELKGTALTITGHGTMYDDYEVPPWGITITSVTFVKDSTGSIESIGQNVFKDCTELKSVDLSSTSISIIGTSAFYGCTGLTSVNLGTKVTSIGQHAFNGCTELTKIAIPNSTTSIKANAFNGCTKLREVTFGTSDVTIGAGAFMDCAALTSIDLSTATSIGNNAFIRCKMLGKVTFGADKLTSIGDGAFEECIELTEVTIPYTTMTIGSDAFNGCTKLGTATLSVNSEEVRESTDIGNNAFSGCTGLTSVKLPSGVKTIGESAFAKSGLEEITIPSTVTSIGKSAFESCTGLGSLTIGASTSNEVTIGESAFKGCTILNTVSMVGDNVTSIGDYAFMSCGTLTGIHISNKVKEIGKYTFAESNLTEITIPDSVKTIGDHAFYKCTGLASIETEQTSNLETIGDYAFAESGLTSVQIRQKVNTVGDYAFNKCARLTNVVISASGTVSMTIGDYAFAESGLTTITIPSRVSNIGDCAFLDCADLTAINVNANNTNYSSDGGVLFNKGQTILIQYPAGKTSTTYAIPDSVKTIKHYAFKKCLNLISLDISDSVTTIEDYAFLDCTSLTSVTFGTGITTNGVGENVFAKEANGVYTNTKFKAIDDSVVTFTKEITEDNLKKLKGWEFRGNFTNMTIVTEKTENGVKYKIDKDSSPNAYVSGYESGITEVAISDQITFGHNPCYVTSIKDEAFKDCKTLKKVTIPGSVTSIGNDAFNGCTELKSVEIKGDSSLKSIGNNAFKECTQMAFGIPTSVESIGDNAFENCKGLGSIDISSVSSLGGNAFKGCTGLKSVTFGSSLRNIKYSAFEGCTGLTKITIPKEITTIGNNAFKGCILLASVTFGDSTGSSLGTIGESAFEGCAKLESVAFPDSVKEIKTKAFAGCDGLTSITFGKSQSSLQSIAGDAFGIINSDKTVTPTKFYDENGKEITLAKIISDYKGQTFTGDIHAMFIDVFGTYYWMGVIYKYNASGVAYVYGYTEDIKSETKILDAFTDHDIACKVTSIAENAFKDCTILTSVTIPDSVEIIEESAFEGCKNMASVTLPDGITEINDRVFYGCKALTSITIPDSVETIGEKAFGGCDGLDTIHFGNGITEIAEDAFCDSKDTPTKFNDELKKQIYPSSDIGKFRGQTFKGDISVMSLETLGYCIIDGVIYVVPLSGEAYVYGCTDKINSETKILDSVTIDGDTYKVTSIGAGAFEDCTKLTSITIPDSVKDIKEYAFLNCTNLETVSFGTGIETVDPTAFSTGKKGGDIVPTVFYDENHDPIDLSAQAEKLRGEMFKGDIYEMTITRTITIDDGTSTQTYTGRVGDKIPRPADPTRDGYKFLYWADEDGNEFDWTIPAKDIKVTAVWKAVSPSGDDDDDNPPYNPSGEGSENTNGSDRDSVNFLIIVACIAAFMAVLGAYVCSGKR